MLDDTTGEDLVSLFLLIPVEKRSCAWQLLKLARVRPVLHLRALRKAAALRLEVAVRDVGSSHAQDVLDVIIGLTVGVQEEKQNELCLDATRRRRKSWGEDGVPIVRVVFTLSHSRYS